MEQDLYLRLDDALVIAITIEGVGVKRRLARNLDPLPAELLDGNMGFRDVCVFRDKESSEVQGELFRAEDMGGGFGKN